MKKPDFPLAPLALAAALSSLAGLASAQAAPELPTVTVREQLPAEPGHVRIDAEELESIQAQDVREALQPVPGVQVGGGATPIAQKIYIRGLEDQLVDIRMDGATLGGFIYHHQSRLQFDPFLLKSISIDKGTATPAAGPGALAGSIRLTTKDAADFLLPGRNIGATLGAGYFTNDGWSASVTGYGRTDRLDAVVSLARQENDAYEDGLGRTVPTSGSQQRPALAKLGVKLAPGHELRLGYIGMEDSGARYQRPHMVAFPGNNVVLPHALERDIVTLGWRYAGTGPVHAAEVTLFDDENRNMRTVNGRRYGEAVDGRGVEARFASRAGRHHLQYGLDVQRLQTRAVNPVRVYNPAIINGANNSGREDYDVAGVFIEDELVLGPRWRVHAGTRYDRYDYTDNHGQRFESSGFSPSAGLRFIASDALVLRAGWARALRGVQPKEVFLLDNGPGPRVYLNDPGLRPETARNLELGFDWAQGGWTVQGEVFRQVIDDYIEANFVAGQARRFHAGRVESDGYELAVGRRWTTTAVAVSLAHSRPELNGQPLGDGNFGLGTSYGRTLNLKVNQLVPRWNLELGWAARWVQDLEYQPSGAATGVRATKEGYTVHDVFARWRPLGRDDLVLSFGVRNLFDKFYYDQASYAFGVAQNQILGFPEPGRDIRLEARWSF